MGFNYDNLSKKNIIGICGGFQMLGNNLIDKFEVEEGGSETGLSLLNFDTIFAKEKTTRQIQTKIINFPDFMDNFDIPPISGYEIHMGSTTNASELYFTQSDITDNCGFVNMNVLGTYIHGIFENDDFVDALISGLVKKSNKKVILEENINDFDVYKQLQYDKLADLVEESLDINKLFNILDTQNI